MCLAPWVTSLQVCVTLGISSPSPSHQGGDAVRKFLLSAVKWSDLMCVRWSLLFTATFHSTHMNYSPSILLTHPVLGISVWVSACSEECLHYSFWVETLGTCLECIHGKIILEPCHKNNHNMPVNLKHKCKEPKHNTNKWFSNTNKRLIS